MKSYLVGHVKDLDSTAPTGEFEVILSAPTLDRDNEIIDGHAFDPLPDHITFDVDHGMTTSTTVGSGQPYYDGDTLKVKGAFSSIPRAQEVRALVAEGHIRTTSVAYMGARTELKDGVRHIVKAELLNGAFVAVPSNRQAVVLGAKDLTETRQKAVTGSYEDRYQRIYEAITVANAEAWWVTILATFDDNVVYEIEGRDGLATFQAGYTINDTGEVTVTDAIAVDIHEVIEPKNHKHPADAPEDSAAASASAHPPAAVAWARAIAATAEVDLL
jgi:hypothetical protein